MDHTLLTELVINMSKIMGCGNNYFGQSLLAEIIAMVNWVMVIIIQ